MQPQVSIISIVRTRPMRGKMLGRFCLAGALILCFGSGGAALADHTFARAELTAHGGAEGTCPQEACAGAGCTVYVQAKCVGSVCSIQSQVECSANPCSANLAPVTAELYASGSTTCDADTLLGNLLAGAFDIPESDWVSAMASGDFLVTANLGDAGGGTEAKVSGNLLKADAVPTVSDWGMVVMLVLVLAVGSVLYRRRRARC